MSKEEVKQLIIMRAIECIESEGIQNVTVRKIAKSAGVNIAAINYHFGSKEKLIQIAIETTLNESFVENIKDYNHLWKNKPKEALQLFLKDTLEGAVHYPNLTKAHLSEAFLNDNYETVSVVKTNEFLVKLHELIKSILKTEKEVESKIAVMQLFSSILLIGMMPGVFDDFHKMSLDDPSIQVQFVEVLLQNFIK